ncbi:MAG: hypothetical protein WD490_02905 [Opitutales bacterium]
MENPGETLVDDYLRYIKECDFVNYNVYTKETQGEIDVIGLRNNDKCAYICEVVTHVTTGMQCVRDRRPETGKRLVRKFLKDIVYGRHAFPDYTVYYMLWSPVVKDSGGKDLYNQFQHLNYVREEVLAETDVTVQFVINEDYLMAIDDLRAFAKQESKELKSPLMRFLQIEEWAKKHVALLNAREGMTAHRRDFDFVPLDDDQEPDGVLRESQ